MYKINSCHPLIHLVSYIRSTMPIPRRIKSQTLIEGHLYMVPRLFAGYEPELHQKYGCAYDLCVYSKNYQYKTIGRMVNFYVLESDSRKPYPPGQIWSTSTQKYTITDGKKTIYPSVDVTPVFARKIQRWYTQKRKERAATFISHTLFEHMITPGQGWLYKRAQQRWNTSCVS